MVSSFLIFIGLVSSPLLARPELLPIYKGKTMGTTYTIKVRGLRPVDIHAGIERILEHVNHSMSTYRDDSEITELNRSAPGMKTKVSPSFIEVLGMARRIHQETRGAFEPTVGPLVELWGFGRRKEAPKHVPSKNELAEIRKKVGLNYISHRDFLVSKKIDGLQLDFSAIAKGYAVDLVSDYLKTQGFQHFLVEIGGELRASGQKAPGQDWKIGIEAPIPGERGVMKVVKIAGFGLATSGDYRNFYQRQGRWLNHIIDPRTGEPSQSRVASVSVFAKTCAEADAYATAFMVMGVDEGLALANKLQLRSMFIKRTDSGFEPVYSHNFKEILVQ